MIMHSPGCLLLLLVGVVVVCCYIIILSISISIIIVASKSLTALRGWRITDILLLLVALRGR
jgi:uncharacterized membrane protein YsdA (DUF1294 family)